MKLSRIGMLSVVCNTTTLGNKDFYEKFVANGLAGRILNLWPAGSWPLIK